MGRPPDELTEMLAYNTNDTDPNDPTSDALGSNLGRYLWMDVLFTVTSFIGYYAAYYAVSVGVTSKVGLKI